MLPGASLAELWCMYADATFDILATAQRIREVATEAARKAAGVGPSGPGRTEAEKAAAVDGFVGFVKKHSTIVPRAGAGVSTEAAEGAAALAQLDRFMVGGGIPKPAPSKE